MKYNKKNPNEVVVEPTDIIEEPIEAEILEQEVVVEEPEAVEETVEEPVVEQIEEAPKTQTYVTVAGPLNLRKEATKQSDIIKTVEVGTKLDISEKKKNTLENAEYGFIPAENAWVNLEYVK